MKLPHALSLSVLLVLGACGGSSGPTALPAASWSEPVPVPAFDVPAPSRLQTLVPDAAGGVTVSWDNLYGMPGFAHRQPSGIWSEVPSIVAAPGSSYRAWTIGASGVDSVLMETGGLTATRFTTGAWSAPVPVASSVPIHASLADSAIYDAHRRLAYSPLATSDGLAPAVTRYDPAAGGWQPIELLPPLPGTTQVYMGNGAIAADGRTMATWWTQVNGEIKFVYYTFRPGAGWSGPAVLPGIDSSLAVTALTPTGRGAAYGISAGVDGSFLISHSRRTTEVDELVLTRLHPNTGWEPPVIVASAPASTGDYSTILSRVYQGDGGHILAIWVESRQLESGRTEVWWSRFYDPAKGWTPQVRAPAVQRGTAVRVDAPGKVLVASLSGISTLNLDGQWVTVNPLPYPTIQAFTYFAIESSGDVTAVWPKLENNRTTFMSSTYR